MPDKPDSWAKLLAFLAANAPMLYAAALACFIAFMRVMYCRGGWRLAFLESCLCGAFTAGAFPLLDYFGLPQSLAAALGAFLGMLGVKKIAALADRFADLKLPGSSLPPAKD